MYWQKAPIANIIGDSIGGKRQSPILLAIVLAESANRQFCGDSIGGKHQCLGDIANITGERLAIGIGERLAESANRQFCGDSIGGKRQSPILLAIYWRFPPSLRQFCGDSIGGKRQSPILLAIVLAESANRQFCGDSIGGKHQCLGDIANITGERLAEIGGKR
ncbi:hypothetical protein DM01DRAFT_1349544 [Hesseltinella vesiculosa]|uniref:Uncharacterized protein n=1 Tax=Hesseltinella vesiculosa TaxID=101127 RepID=A0A1X2G4R0_9FUNG|nr:hypothetical protein DM01DRAFT_1349544 [Hesseltinella vesiculosa]